MGIKDLPKAGHNFKVSAGAGNFEKKLNSATRYGDLNNLQDNKQSIIKVIKDPYFLKRIRTGGLDRLDRLKAWNKIRADDKKITKDDAREIKQILSHLGRSKAQETAKTARSSYSFWGGSKPEKKAPLPDNVIKRNLNYRRSQMVGEEPGHGGTRPQFASGFSGPAASPGGDLPPRTGFAGTPPINNIPKL